MKKFTRSAFAVLTIHTILACSKSQTTPAADATIVNPKVVHMNDSGASGDIRRILEENLPGNVTIAESQFSSNKGLYNVDCNFVKDVATKCTGSATTNGDSDVTFTDDQAQAIGYVFMSNIGESDKGVADAAEIKAGFVACNKVGDEAEIKNIDVKFYANRDQVQSYSPEFFKLKNKIGYHPN